MPLPLARAFALRPVPLAFEPDCFKREQARYQTAERRCEERDQGLPPLGGVHLPIMQVDGCLEQAILNPYCP